MGNDTSKNEYIQQRADHYIAELINQIQEDPLSPRIASLVKEYNECIPHISNVEENDRVLIITINAQIMMEASRVPRREDRLAFLKEWFNRLTGS
jgi:hypothetical protein